MSTKIYVNIFKNAFHNVIVCREEDFLGYVQMLAGYKYYYIVDLSLI